MKKKRSRVFLMAILSFLLLLPPGIFDIQTSAVYADDEFAPKVISHHSFESGYDNWMVGSATGSVIQASDGRVIDTDFEDGTSQGWNPRGDGVDVKVVEGVAHDGNYSLATTGRNDHWHGPSIDASGKLQREHSYRVSVWAKLATGEEPASLQISAQRSVGGGNPNWDNLGNPVRVTADEWVLLEATYALPTMADELSLYVESPDSKTVSFYIDQFLVEVIPQETIEDIPALQDVFAEYFDIGAAVEPRHTAGKHGEMLKKHYGMMVAENAMKPDAIQPTEGNFNWTSADALFAYAGQHGLKMRYHTLVWHEQTPNWFFLDENGNEMMDEQDPQKREANKELLLERMENHITEVVNRYKGQVASWDVVNEVIDPSASDGMRNSKWYQITGTEFIERAFRLVAELDPEAKLVINDYNTHEPMKRDFLFDLVADMLEKGVRIDGIGHQTHIRTHSPALSEIVQSIEKFAELDLDNEITELDVSIYENTGEAYFDFADIPAQKFTEQAERYRQLFNEFRRLSDHISSVVFWGIGDDHTWLHGRGVANRLDAPFAFDHQLKAKPAYWAIVEEERTIPSLHEVFAEQFQIGAAIEPYQMEGAHGKLLKAQYNSIVAENRMKPDAIQPAEGNFTFDDADDMFAFAEENDMVMRYHTLVWHNQTPNWFFLDEHGREMTEETDLQKREANKQLLLQRLENHITEIVTRYQGKVDSWDVVNEVIDAGRPDGMRNTKWYQITGKDYIKTAFETVKALDPDAKLFINDYNTHEPAKRDALYDLVVELLEDGVPVDGVGHQTHINIRNPHIQLITESIELFADLGLDNQITELDVSIYTDDTTVYATFDDIPDEVFLLQAYRYKQLFEEFVRLSDSISNVTFWGIGDDHTWLTDRPIPRQNAPFVFDQHLQPKLAFWALVDPSRLPAMTKEANAPYGTPVMDGDKDLVWETVPATLIGAGEAFSAAFQTLWDEQHLYLFAEISDATVNANDAVEVFLVENGEVSRHVFERNESKAEGVVVTEGNGGYRLEAVIPLKNNVEAGNVIAFDLRATDVETGNLLSWNDPTHEQESGRNYGELTLLPEVKITEALYGTPEINGEMDAVWEDALVIHTDVWVEGEQGATAKVRTLWDEENLYVFAEVTDSLLTKRSSNVWEHDSVEIFIDQNNEKTAYYQSDDGQFRVNFDNEQSYNGYASPDTFNTATALTEDGYIVEAAMKLSAIEPAEGTVIGFDIQVNNDENDDGRRDSVAIWNDSTGQSYQNTSRFGVLRLSTAPVAEQPDPADPVDPSDPTAELERQIRELIERLAELEKQIRDLEDAAMLPELESRLRELEALYEKLKSEHENWVNSFAEVEQLLAKVKQAMAELKAALEKEAGKAPDDKNVIVPVTNGKSGDGGAAMPVGNGKDENSLPNTATSHYSLLLTGWLTLLLGIGFLTAVCKKKALI
ncbi:Endo-1,4-beta-xylanase, GH35 family [Evansella caseinilytica]|uniref:Beta-xylanase n=1 Tax=Evansella caseinilytica TaxID=1503961 RepID=A0A1H3IKH8_9BACI|nr:endo-1,4-beta-xylanase [Evansella caseinilytica]SDY28353.1 Endo-1,4-beta-xylanase, GH35 family [Evansella caseinilytica]